MTARSAPPADPSARAATRAPDAGTRRSGRWPALSLLLLGAMVACAGPAPEPPRPTPTPPPATVQERVRQEPWLARFWTQLSQAQRRRVTQRARRAEPPVTAAAEVPAYWDGLGLRERSALVFGGSRR